MKSTGDPQDVESNALWQRIAELEAALRPFAKLETVKLSEDAVAPHYWVVIGHPGKSDFTKEDIEKARKAINDEIG